MYNLFKMRKNYFLTTTMSVLTALSTGYGDESAEDIDPILKYYVSHADSAYTKSILTNNPVRFSFEAFTYYKVLGRGGAVEKIDSSATRYFLNGTNIDSSKIIFENERKTPVITLEFPNIFAKDFEHGFFPNDVGGQKLAISFAPDVDSTDLPDGIAIVDREEFKLMELYMYFPEPDGYKRLTRSFRFVDYSGYVFPDSIWEIGAKQGIFSVDFYRLETKIDKIQLLR